MLKKMIRKMLNKFPKNLPKYIQNSLMKKLPKDLKILPESLAGKASVVCVISFFLLISVSGLASDYQSQSWTLSPIGGFFAHILLLAAISALTIGTLLGIYAVYKLKDYALLVVFAVVIGFVVLILR